MVGVLVSGCLGREPTPPIKGTPKSVNLFVYSPTSSGTWYCQYWSWLRMCWCVVAPCIGCPPSWVFTHSRIYLSFLCLSFSVSITLHIASAHHVPSYLFRILASHARSHGYIWGHCLASVGDSPLPSLRSDWYFSRLVHRYPSGKRSMLCQRTWSVGGRAVSTSVGSRSVAGLFPIDIANGLRRFWKKNLHTKKFFRMGEIFRL